MNWFSFQVYTDFYIWLVYVHQVVVLDNYPMQLHFPANEHQGNLLFNLKLLFLLTGEVEVAAVLHVRQSIQSFRSTAGMTRDSISELYQ